MQCVKLKSILFSLITALWLTYPLQADFAGRPEVQLDLLENLVAVWVAQEDAALSSSYKIQATTGNSPPWTIINLTSPTLFSVGFPALALAKGVLLGTTKGVAAWFAWDLTTGNYVIQAAILKTTGWTPLSAQTLSANDGTEQVINNFYKVLISDNGQTIFVVWSANILPLNVERVRISTSTNGGTTFSLPDDLSNLL